MLSLKILNILYLGVVKLMIFFLKLSKLKKSILKQRQRQLLVAYISFPLFLSRYHSIKAFSDTLLKYLISL